MGKEKIVDKYLTESFEFSDAKKLLIPIYNITSDSKIKSDMANLARYGKTLNPKWSGAGPKEYKEVVKTFEKFANAMWRWYYLDIAK